MDQVTDVVLRFAVALFIGLLIGLERGWQERETHNGLRTAGSRTFALFGALAVMLADESGALVLGFAFLSLTGVLATAYVIRIRARADYGITSEIAALVTFSLGAAASRFSCSFCELTDLSRR